MLYLKKYVKFRKEIDYLLICDCSIMQNYELPLETVGLFEMLKTGYDPKKPIGIELEQDVIEDLIDLELISSTKNSNDGFHARRWIELGYSESEFFN